MNKSIVTEKEKKDIEARKNYSIGYNDCLIDFYNMATVEERHGETYYVINKKDIADVNEDL